MHVTITNFVAEVTAEHCMHCSLLWNRKCVTPCKKVSTLFPTTLHADYTEEWSRLSRLALDIYANKVQ